MVKANKFTRKQGQYLTFIYYYKKLNRKSPSFRDFEVYFETSPANVNSMIKTLEKKELITKKKRISRSIELNIDKSELPELE